jgi:hypothetical protein
MRQVSIPQPRRFFVAGCSCNFQLLYGGGATVKEFKSGAEAMKQVQNMNRHVAGAIPQATE